MKILLVTEFFPTGKDLRFSGGVESRTFFVAKYLAKRNEVIVMTSRTGNSPLFEKMFNFKIHRVGPSRKYNPTVGDIFARVRFILSAIKAAKRLEIDIIDGSNFISHFIAARIANNKKIPAVAWYPDVWIGSWIKNSGSLGIFGEILERINLKYPFSSYIAISEQTKKKLKNFIKNRVIVIPCGVDQSEFKGQPSKFPNPTIICISRLTKYKNLRILILAFAHLSTKLNARLIIVGSGPQKSELLSLTNGLKLKNRIKFLENLPRKDLASLIKSSHIFSLPSLVEGFGIATIESAAAGLPYVNSNIPIQREVTGNGKGGFLVDPQDPINFSNHFYKLMTDKNLYQKKSKEGLDLAKKYQWSKIADQTEVLYKSLYTKNAQLRKIG